MSIKVMAEVWDNAEVSGGELLFLLALADRAADDHRCAWPGMSTLMRKSRASRATVYRYVEAMQAQQIIERCPDDEIPEQYSRKGGRETIVWRFQPVDKWVARGEIHSAAEGSQSETPPASRQRSHAETPGVSLMRPEPTTNQTSKKTKTTTSSRSSRRAARARAEDTAEWSDPAAAVFAKEQDDDDSVPGSRPRTARSHGPDSAWGLNGYYRQHVFVAGTGRVGNVNDGAMRRFFAEAKRAGVPADTLRSMVDCFVDDPHLFNRTRTHRWKTFIAHAPMLQDRAENVATYVEGGSDIPRTVRPAGSVSGVPKHILDEILAEVG